MFDVSPPKPRRYCSGASARAWLNSIIGSPSATIEGIPGFRTGTVTTVTVTIV